MESRFDGEFGVWLERDCVEDGGRGKRGSMIYSRDMR